MGTFFMEFASKAELSPMAPPVRIPAKVMAGKGDEGRESPPPDRKLESFNDAFAPLASYRAGVGIRRVRN